MQGKSKVLRIFLFLVLFFSMPLQLVFAGNPPAAAQSSLVATTPGSDSALADGVAKASMTLTLKDAGGLPLAGDTATLSIPSDLAAVISPSSAVLDASGSAVFTISSTNVRTDSINVTDATTSTTLTALGSVTFTTAPSPTPVASSAIPACNKPAPLAAPDLYQVNMQKTTATLFWAPPNDTFDSYTISYGLTASADNYSVSFAMRSTTGAVTYTINALTPKTAYYFKVRANNGCAAGPWSNVKAANVPLSKLPATGPSNIFLSIGLGGAVLLVTGLFFLVF